jgi:rhodanese-related sulfurtransferase
MRSLRRAALVALALAVVPPLPAQTPKDPDAVPRLPLAEFKRGLDAGALLAIDVRAAEAYRNGHIPGSVSIPGPELESHLPALRAEQRAIVTYCA